MKKALKLTSIFMCLIVIVLLVYGCNSDKLITNADYTEYIFDNSRNQYIETGRKMRINDKKSSFTMSFANGASITGSLEVEKDINGLILRIDDEAFAPFKTSYINYLKEEYADIYSEETIQTIFEQVKVQEQLYYSRKHLFSSHSMQLVKAVSEKDKNVNYSIFEGVYDSVKEEDTQYLFKNGKLFTMDKGKASEKHSGTYTINENYITVTLVDDNGENLYKEGNLVQTSYLYTTITYPADFTINTDVDDEDYNKMITNTARLMAGKTIAVLTDSFYLAK